MIQKFTIKNIATYNKTGVEFANLRKINFIYGSNGCGKTTISNFLAFSQNENFSDCELIWKDDMPLKTLVYNRQFREENFGKGNINANAKMDAYGFSKLYDSGTSNESENITKSEAIKMVVAATLNKDDITDMIDPSLFLSNYKGIEEDITPLLEYKNQVWVEYAKAMNFVGATNITKDNEGEKVTQIYIIELLADAKKNILQQALTTSKEKNYNVKNLSSLYNASEQLALKDMIDNEIIENKDVDFKQIATKKEMNEFLINFVNKYNTITVNNEKININPAKVPNNSDEYPYTLASVDKKIYEYENYKSDEENYKTPIAYYAESKKYYYKIEEKI